MTDLEDPDLHQARLQRTASLIRRSGARRVLDLGCGSGGLLQYLLRDAQFERVVGLELSGELLAQAKLRLENLPAARAGRLELVCGSYAEPHPALVGFEAAAMVETIEHVPPEALSRVERAVFAGLRPHLLVVTTPNHEYNPLYDMVPGEFRDPDHKFEWDRARFRDWAQGVARRNGYRVRICGIGEMDAHLGQPTQVALFTRHPAPGSS
ncbi:methyltransferase domain-containing protein [Halomonas urmiana]|uniref:Small RNA 2'-O-methyltransferase n=1 Tax=Halomonas urmiana TaxID=490901 RepID=A0A5R8MIM4_9GAMM|nr:methyltransferase domain-containing protein [Halomonas urmiana]TLF51722.1 methyltransferase domain-containing protein [Halomonas urmiana]